MSNMPWFRMYSEILDDAKIKRICRKTGNSKALIIGVWTCILALANDSPQRGVLVISDDIPHTLEDMEFEMGLPREVIAQLIDEFKALGMMTGNTIYAVSNWEKRQFKSDNSTERVKAFRMKRYSNVIDSESDTDTDKESYTKTESESRPLTTFQTGDEAIAERVYQKVTGHFTIPSKDRIPAVNVIIRYYNQYQNEDETVAALKPFWVEWRNRGYKSNNLNWLIEWAATGDIPKQGGNGSKPTDNKSHDEAVIAELVAERRSQNESLRREY